MFMLPKNVKDLEYFQVISTHACTKVYVAVMLENLIKTKKQLFWSLDYWRLGKYLSSF